MSRAETATCIESILSRQGGGNGRGRFFRRVDWAAFTVSATISFLVYLYTLAPEVTLEWSGSYATGAMYAGGGSPFGFPVWLIYGWLFTKILPFSNVAWRLAVSSAVAGAIACGVIALIVSRGSALLLASTKRLTRLVSPEEARLRFLCGVVAGLGFAFDRVFWTYCVIVESAALSCLLVCCSLCWLLRWGYTVRKTRYLYAAALIYGLALSVRLSLASLAPALPFVVLLFVPRVGRDFLLITATSITTALIALRYHSLPEFIDRWGQFDNLWGTYFFFAIVYGAISIALTIKSKGLLDRWRIATLTAASFLCGLIFYFYLPLASMTNPPVNWGYPRTLEGFAHVLGRGQYERIGEYINDDHFSYFKVAGTYFLATVSAIGLIYLIPTILSFFWLFKTRGRSRRWMLALVSCFCALFLLPIVVVDPLADARPSAQMMSFLLPSHLILMIWSGYGLVYLGTIISRKRDPGKHSLC